MTFTIQVLHLLMSCQLITTTITQVSPLQTITKPVQLIITISTLIPARPLPIITIILPVQLLLIITIILPVQLLPIITIILPVQLLPIITIIIKPSNPSNHHSHGQSTPHPSHHSSTPANQHHPSPTNNPHHHSHQHPPSVSVQPITKKPNTSQLPKNPRHHLPLNGVYAYQNPSTPPPPLPSYDQPNYNYFVTPHTTLRPINPHYVQPSQGHYGHYKPPVSYPTTTESIPRDYFPAPKIKGVLEDEKATTLLDLLDKAKLLDVLDGDGPFTIFAPTNEAFARLDPNLVRTLTDDRNGDFDLLKSVLLYHVVPRTLYSRNFNDDITLETALEVDDGGEDEKPKKRKKQLRMKVNELNGIVTVNGVEVDLNRVDETASNGVIHFIDEVIYPIPTGSIIETLREDDRFSILVDLIEAADLESALNSSSADPLTIFAPTDGAFLELPRSGLEEIVDDKKQVTDLLLKHVVKGTKLSPDLSFVTITSLAKTPIKLRTRKGKVYIGEEGSRLIDGDILTTNGAIQVIDKVLL